MDIRNSILEYKVKFLSNGSFFNEQPIFVLAKDLALTGTDWIALTRARNNFSEGTSGKLILRICANNVLYAATGSHPIYARSITTDSLNVQNVTTGDSTEYTISTVFTSGTKVDLIVKDQNVSFADISITGISNLYSNFNYIGTGYIPDTTPEDILYWKMNKTKTDNAINLIDDSSQRNLSGTIQGAVLGAPLSTSCTGWTYGPIGGAIRLRTSCGITSVTSHRFAVTSNPNSAITVLVYQKQGTIINASLFGAGSGTTSVHEDMWSLRWSRNLVTSSSLEYWFYSNNEQKMSILSGNEAPNYGLGQWHLWSLVLDASTASSSGVRAYVDGISTSYTAITTFPQVNNSRFYLGRLPSSVNVSANACVVGMTRLIERALSANEILYYHLATIPAMMEINSIKIG